LKKSGKNLLQRIKKRYKLRKIKKRYETLVKEKDRVKNYFPQRKRLRESEYLTKQLSLNLRSTKKKEKRLREALMRGLRGLLLLDKMEATYGKS
jgi:hypothetical protein